MGMTATALAFIPGRGPDYQYHWFHPTMFKVGVVVSVFPCLCLMWVGGRRISLKEFRQSLSGAAPPARISKALAGLWSDAKGDWKRAHECAQQDESAEGSWVHAYLHRKEGDQTNAAYWYSRASKPVSVEPLDKEWRGIVNELCG